jgi:hypothetical protein
MRKRRRWRKKEREKRRGEMEERRVGVERKYCERKVMLVVVTSFLM